jgi:hypothetical protein
MRRDWGALRLQPEMKGAVLWPRCSPRPRGRMTSRCRDAALERRVENSRDSITALTISCLCDRQRDHG